MVARIWEQILVWLRLRTPARRGGYCGQCGQHLDDVNGFVDPVHLFVTCPAQKPMSDEEKGKRMAFFKRGGW